MKRENERDRENTAEREEGRKKQKEAERETDRQQDRQQDRGRVGWGWGGKEREYDLIRERESDLTVNMINELLLLFFRTLRSTGGWPWILMATI